MITIDQAQEERKKGKWLVANRKFTTVLYIGKNEDKAYKIYEEHKQKRSGSLIYSPLVKMFNSKAEQMQCIADAKRMYNAGLMCNL
ncbi:MAG: hypothetical protein IIC75_08965 [Bacteroidetes bacterium]|nr:hypothetical protein [Bacteroidota bacterium]